MDTKEDARAYLRLRAAASNSTQTFHISYAGYRDCKLVVRLSEDGRPIEVMFSIEGDCLPYVQRWIDELRDECQILSAALTHGTPLKALVKPVIKPFPLELAVHRYYGQTPAPVANSDLEWVLRHLALTYLTEEECVKIGVHTGFWCPQCNQAEAKPAGHSFFCHTPDCGWSYIN